MTRPPDPSPVEGGWRARLRRWLWLDELGARSDRSRASRDSYIYYRNPRPSRRFMVVTVALGVVLALAVLTTRGADASSPVAGDSYGPAGADLPQLHRPRGPID